MATFWLERSVEGYFWWKLLIGKQFKILEEYSPLPQCCEKWKTTSIFWQIEDALNILANKRQPQYFEKWKTTPIFCQIEDNINFWKMKGNLNIWNMEDDQNILKMEDDISILKLEDKLNVLLRKDGF